MSRRKSKRNSNARKQRVIVKRKLDANSKRINQLLPLATVIKAKKKKRQFSKMLVKAFLRLVWQVSAKENMRPIKTRQQKMWRNREVKYSSQPPIIRSKITNAKTKRR